MAIFEIQINGLNLEIDAPDAATAASKARAFSEQQAKPATIDPLSPEGRAARWEAGKAAGDAARGAGLPPPGQVSPEVAQHQRNVELDRQYGDQSSIGAALDGAANTVFLGFDDNIDAAFNSLVTGKPYKDELAFLRGQQDATQEQFPKSFTAGQIGGALLPLGPAIASTGTLAGRAAKAASVGAVVGGLTGAGNANGENPMFATIVGAGAGALFGGLSVPASDLVSWAARRGGRKLAEVFGRRETFADGRLTDKGRRVLAELGYDPDTLSAAFSREFQKGIDSGIEPQSAAAAADLGEFGIPAYRHNVTGSVDDFATFERARRGGIGPGPAKRVGAAADAQFAAVQRATDDIATGLGRGVRGDQADAAVAVQEGLRKAAEAARSEARVAYGALSDLGAGVPGAQVQGLGTKIGQALRMEGVRVDPAMTPNAASAVGYLDDMFARAKTGTVPFEDIERGRQYLVRLRSAAERGSNGADQFAMGKALDAFDDNLDRLMTSTLVNGGEEALAAAQKARGLWANYRAKFTGKGAVARFVQTMIDADASPGDAVKWLFSAGKMGSGRMNSTIAAGLRDILGENSEAWGMVRQAAFRQLTQKPEGTMQYGAQALAENLATFLNGPTTRQLAAELFSPDERAMMLRLQSGLRRMVPPPGAVNYSGTSYEAARMARAAFRAVMTALGSAGGGPGGAVAANVATGAAQNGASWLSVGKMLSASPAGRTAISPLAGGMAGGQMAGPLLEGFRQQ